MAKKVKVVSIPLNTIDYMLEELNGSEFKVMIFIWRWTVGVDTHAVGVTQDDMARLAGVGRSSLSRIISGLISRDFITTEKKHAKPTTYSISPKAAIPEMLHTIALIS